MKVRVEMLDSIAGLKDPDTKALDAKYEKIAAVFRAKDKPPSEQQIKQHINGLKIADRYNEIPIGFKKDFSYKIGDKPFIEAELAKKWVEAELCILIEEKDKKAA